MLLEGGKVRPGKSRGSGGSKGVVGLQKRGGIATVGFFCFYYLKKIKQMGLVAIVEVEMEDGRVNGVV